MQQHLVKYWIPVLLLILATVSASFYDPQSSTLVSIVSYDEVGSYFGYAVQLARPSATSGTRLMVGAPLANFTKYQIHQPGGAFSCDLDGGGCERFLLDPNGGNSEGKVGNQAYKHSRDAQWLGATLDARGDSLVVCAPRWANSKYRLYLFMNGLCYWLAAGSNNTHRTATTLLPMLNLGQQGFSDQETQVKYYYYAYGQAGMSAHLTGQSGELLIGAPGLLHWKGTAIRYKAGGGTPNVPNPRKITALDFFSYFGYSVSSGEFLIQGRLQYVAGAPRGGSLCGQIFVYDYEPDGSLAIRYEASGTEMGEYFGAAITVADITGDGLDDIIVGAPIYSEGIGGVEAGRVHILASDYKGSFERLPEITGEYYGGRFGSAVASLGDVNSDGFPDIAIGAPYEGRGVVYVYLGSRKGLSDKPYMRLVAEKINPKLSGFGISISRGFDVDDNGVPDIAAGAFLSDQVVISRLRPAAKVDAWLSSSIDGLPVPNDDTTQAPVHKFRVTTCLKYKGKNTPRNHPFQVQFIQDKYYRRTNESNNTFTMSCHREEACCSWVDVIVLNIERIYTEPIELRMFCKPICEEGNTTCPILEKRACMALMYIAYEINCGDDSTCQPELQLEAQWIGKHRHELIIGSRKPALVHLQLNNTGEPAYLCRLSVILNVPLLSMPSRCRQLLNSDLLDCQMGNPLTNTRELLLELDVTQVKALHGPLLVIANVSSVGTESNLTDNKVSLKLPLSTEVNLAMSGISRPDQSALRLVGENETNNISIHHQVEVRSRGPSPLEELFIEVFVPLVDWLLVVEPLNITSNIPMNCTISETSELLSEEVPKLEFELPLNRTLAVSCNSVTPCMKYTCSNDGNDNGYINYAILQLEINVFPNILDEIRGHNDIILLSTTTIVKRTEHIVTDSYQHVSTVLLGEARPADVLWWIVIGSIAGVILLIFIVFLLQRVGFFKRKTYKILAAEMENIVAETEEDCEEENQCYGASTEPALRLCDSENIKT